MDAVPLVAFGHHSEVDQLAGFGGVLIEGVGEDAVKQTTVCARVIEGDVEDVNGGILNVIRVFAAVPVQSVLKTVVQNGGSLVFKVVYVKKVLLPLARKTSQ
uniref:Uncharacterized protein n=1 Tax=Anguilla anguilla TaxID=7936 RepID=A0A0E9V150_ANGAN